MKKNDPAADFIAGKQFSENIQTLDKIVFMKNTVYWLVGDSCCQKDRQMSKYFGRTARVTMRTGMVNHLKLKTCCAELS